MILLNNVSLKKKTTFKIGGVANCFFIPESEQELVEKTYEIYKKNGTVYIISGGSNLLINDEKVFESVISMEKACIGFENLGNGRFFVGASHRIQSVIHKVNECGYGGFEELVCLPAMFGGVIYMNAGIGRESAPLFTISEFVESVKTFNLKSGKIVDVSNEECDFGHRHSIFKNNEYVILGATIKCKSIDKEEASRKIMNRRKHCKENFEYGHGCFGSCFSKFNGPLLRVLSMLYKKHILKYSGEIRFANNNANWLVNDGDGTYKDAIRLIGQCKKLHSALHQDICCEVVIWD